MKEGHTTIPNIDITPKHVETGDTGQLSFEQHCKMAQLEAERQSSPKKKEK
jgi:hypothetical protein